MFEIEGDTRIEIATFFREFQLMVFVSDDNSLLVDQNTNRFLVSTDIEPQITYSTIRDFTS